MIKGMIYSRNGKMWPRLSPEEMRIFWILEKRWDKFWMSSPTIRIFLIRRKGNLTIKRGSTKMKKLEMSSETEISARRKITTNDWSSKLSQTWELRFKFWRINCPHSLLSGLEKEILSTFAIKSCFKRNKDFKLSKLSLKHMRSSSETSWN
jgi:hypothetical protein